MVFTPNSTPTEITINTETNIVTISQRIFGSDRINSVSVDLDSLQEFMEFMETIA